ncbi:MAG TPA: ribosomal protein S18-alanine N-acetyltransferase [Rhodocyclaceae bacterium]|nr:ribosomal protein S18-alanine N-acetyltransferase [Rhodocyclaceae bacterium]
MNAVIASKIQFAPMREADLDQVAALERRIYDFPWTRGNFADSIASGYGVWLMREGGALTGYAVMMVTPDEAQLLNISVAPEYRRAGYGTALLLHLAAQARAHGAKRLLLEVRPSNVAGLALYRRQGFLRIGLRRGYYPAALGREDALVLAKDLVTTP